MQEIAGNKLAANDCASSTNKFLQVCIDAAIAQVASDNAAISAARKLEYTQSLLTKPVLNSNGEVIRTALLKSKSLNAKDIKTVLDTANLTTSDKELLTLYAQKINSIKGSQSTKTIKIPLSKTPSEEFNSATPTVCAVVSGLVKTLKPGVCILNIKFATESGFEVQTTKKITLKK